MLVRLLALMAALFSAKIPAHAEPSQPAAQVGDTYHLTARYETSERDSDGSTGSSGGSNSYLERVVAVRPDGVELEYDLPADVPAENRARYWQFPARVLKPVGGPLQLLNRSELEARVEAWLSAAKLPRAACGSWYFTWNAFQVECDPQTVLALVERLTLPNELRDGALYEDAMARQPAPLRRSNSGSASGTYIAEMAVDAEAVRRERVEADLALAQIMRTPATREEALRVRSAEQVSGTIRVTFESDVAGRPFRRTRVTELETREPSGRIETMTATETLERRRE